MVAPEERVSHPSYNQGVFMWLMKILLEVLGWPYFVMTVLSIVTGIGSFAYLWTHDHGFWFSYAVSSCIGMVPGILALYFMNKHLEKSVKNPKPLRSAR